MLIADFSTAQNGEYYYILTFINLFNLMIC